MFAEDGRNPEITTWDVEKQPCNIFGYYYLSTGAGFLPSTVVC